MPVTIYNAVSLDGYIADNGDNTAWVSDYDWDQLAKLILESDCIIMGYNTYKVITQDSEEGGEFSFPYGECINYVLTSKNINNKFGDKAVFTDQSIESLIKEIGKNKKILCVGGGKLNASLINSKCVNKIIADIHPIILGSGVEFFDGLIRDVKLVKESVEELEDGLIKSTYSVKY